jgi:uncharacterized phage protein (TIGR02218 family)
VTAKTIPIGLAARYAAEAASLAHCLRIQRTDGQVFAFTSAAEPATIDGTLYGAGQGLEVGDIVTTATLSVDNLEMSTLDDGTLFTEADVLGRVWANAAFKIGRYAWDAPADGVEWLIAGTIGNIVIRQGRVTVELRGLQQYLQQPIGDINSKTCRARVADFPTPAGNNLCRLSAASIASVLTVTAVTSRRQFTASGSPMTDDWYGEGVLTWTAGDNDGFQARVKTQTAAGVFTLHADMPHDIAIGDTISAVAGCRKRLDEDCAAKFGNALNFQAEPHAPMVDALTAAPEPGA